MAYLTRVHTVRFVDAAGKRCLKSTPGARKLTEESSKWYGCGVPGWPASKRVPLATDKTAAERMLQDLVRRAERGQTSLPDGAVGRMLLTELLDEFRVDMELGLASKTRTRRVPSAKQVALCVQRVRDVLTSCRFQTPADLTDAAPAKLARHLTMRIKLLRKDGGCSHQTAGFVLAAVKRFTRWLSVNKRCPVRPDLFDAIPSFDATNHRVHARRECSPEELARILDSALTGPDPLRLLKGESRYFLYLTAFATGFRAGELASLTPSAFDLTADPPAVALSGRVAKNRKRVRQPLPAAVAVQLARFLDGKPADRPVWPGKWTLHAARMLRVDLEAAGVPYTVEVDGEKLYLDFHALRHSFVSALASAGIGPRELQELARHSDPRLTLGIYSHTRPAQLGASVNRLTLPGGSTPGRFVHLTRAELERQLTAALDALAAAGISHPEITRVVETAA